ncbi:MAG: DNA-directed polymerase subunit [Thermoplasmata archaeon]|nr:DNA-directed polymerase subunit [Thermoplasmata archaeon]
MTDEVRFNVLNHVNVPKHELLPDDEVKALLKQFGIVKEQLPKIRSNDPAVQVIDGKAGQVVKVIRRSPTAGTATAYRLIVEAI